MSTLTPHSKEIAALADDLVNTLSEAHAMLSEMEQRLSEKLEAIKTRDADLLTQTTLNISQTTARLDTLSAARERKMQVIGRLLDLDGSRLSLDQLVAYCAEHAQMKAAGRELDTWQDKMREQALNTQQRCEEVAFALQYATRLGQEMLQLLRGESAADTATYTAAGQTASNTPSHPLVNHFG